MAYKMGLLLSVPFLMLLLLFMADLADIALIRNGLDSVALTVAYRIASEGRLSEATRQFVSEFGAEITLNSVGTPRIGDTVIFTITKSYAPFVVSREPMIITLKRSTVVGYYDR